jgi:hypothetical protein
VVQKKLGFDLFLWHGVQQKNLANTVPHTRVLRA